MKLSPVFERRLAQHNRAHPNHPPTLIRYNPQAVKARWETRSYGAVVRGWRYQGRWEVGAVLTTLPRGFQHRASYLGQGRWFFKIFAWYDADPQGKDCGYLHPDERIFLALELMDTTKERHFERSFEEPEERREAARQQEHRALTKAGVDYWGKHDRLVVPVGSKDVTARRSWRHRYR